MANKRNNISFFIPVYNAENTIIESIESILVSNFIDGDELILVNDCSTDKTPEVISKYAEKYPSIKIINHIRNKGGGAARNTAIENAKNNLLFCLDSDNVLENNSIEPLYQYLSTCNAEVASFQSLYYFSKSIKEVDYVWTLKAGIFLKEIALTNELTPGAGGNYLFTKKSWVKAGGYPEYSGALDTWAFGIQQLLSDSKVVVLENSYYYHRLLENSYYIRDAWEKRKAISIRATQILIPYFDQIHENDINYMLSRKHRNNWFNRLDKRSIRIVENKKDKIYDGLEVKKIISYNGFIKTLKKVKQKINSIIVRKKSSASANKYD